MKVAILVVFVFGMVVSLLARPGSPIAWITGLLRGLLVNLGVFALDVGGPATKVDFAYWFITNGEPVLGGNMGGGNMGTRHYFAVSISCPSI